MEIPYLTIDEPATPEFVLACIRDMHRQQCQFDFAADASVTLSFDTTVSQWRDACDFDLMMMGWRALGRAQNEWWGLCLSDSSWKSVLTPMRKRRLRDVCELIASHARQPRIRPACLLGRPCKPAGAFLTVRSMLSQAGADVSEIAPSTLLAPYARRYWKVFLLSISRLAPGALPDVTICEEKNHAASLAAFALMACLTIGLFGQIPLMIIIPALALMFLYVASLFMAGSRLPARVAFGELRTFRDLAMVLSSTVEPSDA